MKIFMLSMFLTLFSGVDQETIKISTTDWNDETKEYVVKATDTVLSLKQKIVGDSGIDVSSYILEFNDKVLEDLKTLGEYGIINGSDIKVKKGRNRRAKRVG